MNSVKYGGGTDQFEYSGEEWKESEETYCIDILTTCDEDGVFSTVALNLPGAGSCGPTRGESIDNAIEAIKGVIQSYKDAGAAIPWIDPTVESIGSEGERKRIIVRV